MIRHFTDHPASVNETYFGHMVFALTFAGWMLLAAGAALVHAILPFAFDSTASRIVARLAARNHQRFADASVPA